MTRPDRRTMSTAMIDLAPARPTALSSVLSALVVRWHRRRAAARHARALTELSPAQLADAGIDMRENAPPRAILTVERGLMGRLMDMR